MVKAMRKRRKSAPLKLNYVPVKAYFWIGISLLLFTTYEVFIKYAEPRLLPIKHIELNALFEKTDPVVIKHHLRRHVKGFISTDVLKLKQEILNLPFVDEVIVKRIWPDKLLITLVEQKLIAVWDENFFVNNKGEVIGGLGQSSLNLPRFHGPAGQSKLMLDQYNQMSKALESVARKIVELDLTSRRSWQLTLDNGLKLILGRKDFSEKLAAMIDVYPKLKLSYGDHIDSIDLRHPNGFSVHTK